jgi:DNA-binding CsgD family transcriptional regulator
VGKQLVARERELAELVTAVTDGSGAVLSGAVGVGKTALAAAVARHVEPFGDRVERMVATDASRSISFGALAPVLPPDIIPLHPALVLAAIRRRQDELGGTARALFVVDDAHLLDDHSAATLLGLVSTGAVRLVATVRTGEPAPDAVHALWKDGFVAHHEIAPFDRPATQQFLGAILGGEVAAGTASMLWQHTRGNALYLSELAHDARANHRLVDEHGVWIWRGDLTVPPRLADLLDRRFDGLSPAGLDALGALVLGEPLPFVVLEDIATEAGLAELEACQVVATNERDGVTWYRFAHPMLGAAAANRLTPTRRRRLARTLSAAPSSGADIVRRAMWQLDVSDAPDVDVLRSGAAAVFLTQPALARRLAERALPHDPTPLSALLLADAHAELGEVDAARNAQALATERISSDDDRLHVRLNQVSLIAFSDRRPDLALDALASARTELPDRYAPEIESMAAQVTVFSARPAEALERAERVLDGSPPRASALRATSARVMALAMVDRSVEAINAAERLLAEVAAGPATPYAQGIAHIAAQIARFVYWAGQDAPATDPSGRWPVPPADGGRALPTDPVFHPLFEGGRRLLEGQVAAAIAPLREAVAQQRSGEGLLRSEAVALLVVALAATGNVIDARQLLDQSPPDRVAVYPGLRSWAVSAVDAADGRPTAVALAFDAYGEARAAGSPISAVAYLAAAARYGAAARADAELSRWGHRFESPISAARAVGIAARASGDTGALLTAAEQHAALGVAGDAVELADLAVAAIGNVRAAARAKASAFADDLRRRLRQAELAPAPVIALTRRELEVATLAARGMSDQDIAATLVISVRTVESHLAATYRKLAINSRRGLRHALVGGDPR